MSIGGVLLTAAVACAALCVPGSHAFSQGYAATVPRGCALGAATVKPGHSGAFVGGAVLRQSSQSAGASLCGAGRPGVFDRGLLCTRARSGARGILAMSGAGAGAPSRLEPGEGAGEDKRVVFVGNMPWVMDTYGLRKIFEPHGEVPAAPWGEPFLGRRPVIATSCSSRAFFPSLRAQDSSQIPDTTPRKGRDGAGQHFPITQQLVNHAAGLRRVRANRGGAADCERCCCT